MKELFDQSTEMMKKAWDAWEKAVEDSPWLQKPDKSFLGTWGPWFATMRSTYDVNMNAWQTVVSHSEETFFKVFKDSPVHNDAHKRQLREMWDGMKKAAEVQKEIISSNLERMENLLKESE